MNTSNFDNVRSGAPGAVLPRRNPIKRMSLLARLPATETELNSHRGSLPLLHPRLQQRRKTSIAPAATATSVEAAVPRVRRRKESKESGVNPQSHVVLPGSTAAAAAAPPATATAGNAAALAAGRTPPVVRLASQPRLQLPETEVIIEEEESAPVSGSVVSAAPVSPSAAMTAAGAVGRRSSITSRYSRHRYNSTIDDPDGLIDSDNDDALSQAGSMTSGRSRTPSLRPPGTGSISGSLGMGRKSRRRTEHSVAPGSRPQAADGISHIIKFRRPWEALSLFRRSVRKVMHVLTWMVVLSKKDSKIENQLKTFFDMAQEIEDSSTMKHIEQQTGISFDPKYFRTSKQVYTQSELTHCPDKMYIGLTFHITFELRRCLTLISDCRTEDMVQRVVTGLQCLEAFAEYPLHMQFKLAQVAWYQELPPKRMIIRQGHKAENFYFILSGTGIAKQLVKEEDTGRVINRVIARLSKGQSFGEVALVHHQERSATVESVTHMQLLVVSREDFLDIFFATTDGGEPEHLNFCRQVDFLRHWPVEKANEEPEEVLFHYFRRGTVVVQDSRKNDWIYIVKSGTCMVLKKLKSVYPQRTWCPEKTENESESLSFPRIGPRIDSRIATARKRHKVFSIPKALSQEMTAFFSKQFQQSNDTMATTSDKTEAPTSPTQQADDPALLGVTFKDGALSVPDVSKMEKRSNTPRSDGSATDRKRKLTMRSAPGPLRISPRVLAKPKSIRGVLDAYMKSMETYIKRFKERTFDDHSCKNSWKDRPEEPCFVQLRKLRPRDAFVSNGAEMIMLSRKFFTKYANDHVKQFIREKIRPFPSEETLQENLQNKVNWDLYRQHAVNEVLTYRGRDNPKSKKPVVKIVINKKKKSAISTPVPPTSDEDTIISTT